MIKFVNLTPHALNIHSNGNVTNIEPSGQIARVNASYKRNYSAGGIDIYNCVYGDLNGLPEPKDFTLYIVSGMVKSAVPGRTDVLSPGELIRDSNGNPIGCKGLCQ